MPTYEGQELSAREWTLMEAEKEERRETFEHAVTIKRLELEIERQKNNAELEVRLLESKISSWLSLPKYVLKLPVLLVLGVGYVVHAIRKTKPSQEFWEFMKK